MSNPLSRAERVEPAVLDPGRPRWNRDWGFRIGVVV